MRNECQTFITKEKETMQRQEILLKLTDFLMKENLISPVEKLKAVELIRTADNS